MPELSLSSQFSDEDDQEVLPDFNFQYDLAVIGGGSGGISAVLEAKKLGLRSILFDYVEPSFNL
jgi:heterodisulfide reductase subunit A-like polyferredoxin